MNIDFLEFPEKRKIRLFENGKSFAWKMKNRFWGILWKIQRLQKHSLVKNLDFCTKTSSKSILLSKNQIFAQKPLQKHSFVKKSDFVQKPLQKHSFVKKTDFCAKASAKNILLTKNQIFTKKKSKNIMLSKNHFFV